LVIKTTAKNDPYFPAPHLSRRAHACMHARIVSSETSLSLHRDALRC